jgi:hypothetical protein
LKNKNAEGYYILKTKVGSEYIHLKKDSLFDFECRIPMLQSKSSGSWYDKGKYIIIKSFPIYKNDWINVTEVKNEGAPTVQILDKNNNPVFGVQLYINNKYINSSNLKGFVYLININLNKGDVIEFSTLDLSSEKRKYIIKNNDCNSIIANIYPIELGSKFFEKDTLIFKGNKLIYKNSVYVRRG